MLLVPSERLLGASEDARCSTEAGAGRRARERAGAVVGRPEQKGTVGPSASAGRRRGGVVLQLGRRARGRWVSALV